MKVAKFSNGFEDVYKGKRDVKAAWMITSKETGEVVKSGHSLDAQKAQKTAHSNLPQPRHGDKHWARYEARKTGKTSRQILAQWAAENAAEAEKYSIEVVAL